MAPFNTKITKMMFLLVTVLAAVALAAPPRPLTAASLLLKDATKVLGGRDEAGSSPTAPTDSASTATIATDRHSPAVVNVTCVNAPPDTDDNSTYPIHSYHGLIWVGVESYTLKQEWYNEHYLSGPHYIGVGANPLGPFKCQWICNGHDDCNSFFGWYMPDDEGFNCVLFDEVIDYSLFERTTGINTAGAWNRRCTEEDDQYGWWNDTTPLKTARA